MKIHSHKPSLAVTVVALLVLVTSTKWTFSHPLSEPGTPTHAIRDELDGGVKPAAERDQYSQPHSRQQNLGDSSSNSSSTRYRSLIHSSRSTDYPLDGLEKPQHRFSLIHKIYNANFDADEVKLAKNNEIAELQVGCENGLIQETTKDTSLLTSDDAKYPKIPSQLETIDPTKRIHRKSRSLDAQNNKQKRSYYPYASPQVYHQQVPYQSITVWQPPYYQLNRPYVIPIWGAPGRPTLYFPPQPIYVNPGLPPDNPQKRPFAGPPYLPPRPPVTPPPEITTLEPESNVTLVDRGGDFIWDAVEPEPTTSRPTQAPQGRPTRRPRPPGARPATYPPLIHGGSGSSNPSSDSGDSSFEPPPPPPPAVRPRPTSRPFTSRPPQSRPSTPRPAAAVPPPAMGPSTCVWAIISCCSTSGEIRYECFEQRGCPGAFWDNNPCDNDFARAAIESALKYYDGQ